MLEKLEEGKLILIPKDDLANYLRERICDGDRLALEKIADFCFSHKATAVFLFIDLKHGNYRCSGYMPIFDNEDALKKCSNDFGSIEDSMFLGVFKVDDISELEDNETLDVIKKRASRLGYWHNDYAIIVFC